MDDGIDFRADHQDKTGQEEPQNQDDQAAKTAVRGIIAPEIGYVERKSERYELP